MRLTLERCIVVLDDGGSVELDMRLEQVRKSRASTATRDLHQGKPTQPRASVVPSRPIVLHAATTHGPHKFWDVTRPPLLQCFA